MTREEYGQAYERGFELTVRFLLSRGAFPRDRARDAAQAAWTKGWERLPQLRNQSFITVWVNTIALNVYRGFLRRERPLQALPEDVKKTEINLAAIDIGQILKICRPSDRALLDQQMRGVTAKEVALREGITQTCVRIRFLRARRAARSRVEMHARKSQNESGPTSANTP
jgi:DNA-directed RNA polymerase specialized sigma24 family protein